MTILSSRRRNNREGIVVEDGPLQPTSEAVVAGTLVLNNGFTSSPNNDPAWDTSFGTGVHIGGTLGALRQQQNVALEQANQVAAQQELARMDAFRAQQRQAEAMRAQGIAQAVSGGLLGAGDAASAAGAQRQQVQIAEIEAAAKAESTDSLLNRLGSPQEDEDDMLFDFQPRSAR